jgi:hypothetical protein
MATIRGQIDHAVLSRPVRVHWAGWETDTYRLQKMGWQIAVDYRPDHASYVLMMKSEQANMYCITDHCHIAFWDQVRDDMHMTDTDFYHRESMLRHQIFNVSHVGLKGEIRMNYHHEVNFQLIDATPTRMPIDDLKIQSIEDMNVFKKAESPKEQIIVDKADMSVVEHLEAIKRLQSPVQDQIRERMRRDDYVQEGETEVTNIIAFPLGAA